MEPINIGQCVTFVDAVAREHDALVTAIHGWQTIEERTAHYQKWRDENPTQPYVTDEWFENVTTAPFNPPSINVVYVSTDETKADPYGRQLEQRATSIVHQTVQSAHGMYWKHK